MKRLIVAALNYLLCSRHRCGAVLRQQGGGSERQAASRRCQDELREEMQARHLRGQSGERRRHAALWCGQKELHGEVREGCLDVAGFSVTGPDDRRQAGSQLSHAIRPHFQLCSALHCQVPSC
jgi:hypothetical protein